MSFRRHYGGGGGGGGGSSYSSSLASSPATTSYSSRGLGGGYSSPYATPLYSSPHGSYGGYGSYGKSGVRTRSSSLPRDTKDRSLSRHGSLSRGSSPPRTTNSALLDLTSAALNRHHSFNGSKTTVLPIATARNYSRDYGSHYASAKALARAARSKSIGSGSISSLSSGYCSRSGVSVHHHIPLTSFFLSINVLRLSR